MYSSHDVSFDEDLDLDRVLAGEFKILSPYNNKSKSDNSINTTITNSKVYDESGRKELITNVMGQFHNLMADIKIAEREVVKSPPLSPNNNNIVPENTGIRSTYVMESVDAMISALLELKKGLSPIEADLLDNEIQALKAQQAKKNMMNKSTKDDGDNNSIVDDSLTMSPLRLPVSNYDLETSSFNRIKSPVRDQKDDDDDDDQQQPSFADRNIEKLQLLVDSFMTSTQIETQRLAASILNNNNNNDKNTNTPSIERLQTNMNSLMGSIRDERNQRSVLERKLLSVQEELAETKIQNDVEKENYKLNLIKMKGQIRQLCSNSGLGELCSNFESEVQRLSNENEVLRRKLLTLEEKDDLEFYDRNMLHTNTSIISQDGSFVSGKESNKMQRQLIKIRRLGQEKEELKTVLEELKKKERIFHSSACIAHDASRRFQIASQENTRLKEELEKEKSKRLQYEEDIKHLHLDLHDFQHSESRIRDEYNRKMQELTGLRSKVIQLEQENKNITKLNRFISKHTPDPDSNNVMGKKLPLQGSSYSSTIKKVSSDDQHIVPTRVIQGYLEQMDEKNMFNPNIDTTISILQDSLMCHAPILLPMLRKLTTEIHSERTKILTQREKLLLSVFKPNTLKPKPSSNEPSAIESKAKTNTKSNPMRYSC